MGRCVQRDTTGNLVRTDPILSIVNTQEESNIVQQALSRVGNSSGIWQINFNYKKCNHMHLGRDQPFSSYYMIVNGKPDQIKNVEEQKDLEVIIDNKLKFVPHIQAVVNKANRNLRIIKRTFKYLDKSGFFFVFFFVF